VRGITGNEDASLPVPVRDEHIGLPDAGLQYLVDRQAAPADLIEQLLLVDVFCTDAVHDGCGLQCPRVLLVLGDDCPDAASHEERMPELPVPVQGPAVMRLEVDLAEGDDRPLTLHGEAHRPADNRSRAVASHQVVGPQDDVGASDRGHDGDVDAVVVLRDVRDPPGTEHLDVGVGKAALHQDPLDFDLGHSLPRLGRRRAVVGLRHPALHLVDARVVPAAHLVTVHGRAEDDVERVLRRHADRTDVVR
jgi:hypothetical protein